MPWTPNSNWGCFSCEELIVWNISISVLPVQQVAPHCLQSFQKPNLKSYWEMRLIEESVWQRSEQQMKFYRPHIHWNKAHSLEWRTSIHSRSWLHYSLLIGVTPKTGRKLEETTRRSFNEGKRGIQQRLGFSEDHCWEHNLSDQNWSFCKNTLHYEGEPSWRSSSAPQTWGYCLSCEQILSSFELLN